MKGLILRGFIYNFLLLFVIQILVSCRSTSAPRRPTAKQREEQNCRNDPSGRGVWSVFQDSAGDSCALSTNSVVPVPGRSESCDCGVGFCWNGERCEVDPNDRRPRPSRAHERSRSFGGCTITGRHGEVCSDREVLSPAIYHPYFVCFGEDNAQCSRVNGRCDWSSNVYACVAQIQRQSRGGGGNHSYRTPAGRGHFAPGTQ